MASQVNKINMDIWKEHVDGLLAWLQATVGGSGGGGPKAIPIDVVNTGPIPAGGPAQIFDAILGGDGMPAPASYTSKTGVVEVEVQIGCVTNIAAALYTLQMTMDGVPFGAKLDCVSVESSADGLGSRIAATMTAIVSPAAGPHTYGIHLVGSTDEGGGPNTALANPGYFQVTCHDLDPGS